MRRAILTVLCCNAGENGEERETGDGWARGRVRGIRGVRVTVNR